MYCDECGKPVKNGAKFCAECGSEIDRNEESITEKKYDNINNDCKENNEHVFLNDISEYNSENQVKGYLQLCGGICAILLIISTILPIYNFWGFKFEFIKGDGIFILVAGIVNLLLCIRKKLSHTIWGILGAVVIYIIDFTTLFRDQESSGFDGVVVYGAGYYVMVVAIILSFIIWILEIRISKNWETLALIKRIDRVKVIIFILVITIFAVPAVIIYDKYIGPIIETNKSYEIAQNDFENENYEDALVNFTEINEYKDSAEMALECQYLLALNDYENENFDSAKEKFMLLGEYKESKNEIVKCHYESAKIKYEDGQFDEALALFNKISDYEDVSNYISEIKSIKVIEEVLEEGFNENNIYSVNEVLAVASATPEEYSLEYEMVQIKDIVDGVYSQDGITQISFKKNENAYIYCYVFEKVDDYIFKGDSVIIKGQIVYNKDTEIMVDNCQISAVNGNEVTPESNENINNISSEEAINIVLEFMENTGAFIPPYIEIDSETESEYTVHAYEINSEGCTATVNWYYVEKSSGVVTSMF